MPRFLIYIDCADKSIIDEAFSNGIDNRSIDEYYTLTEDGQPIVFEDGQVSNPEWCNGIALRCGGITEE